MSATCKDLARIALAFALTSTMLSLPYSSPKTWDLLQFVRMASRMAMQEKALHASSPQAPYVSTASGMHCQPSSEHFVSFCSSFLDSAAFAATPAETPASETILGLSGEVTVMSIAAPTCHYRISAGLVLSSLLPKPHPASRRAGNEAH